MLWQLLILCHHYHFFPPACSLFIFYNICSSAHTISLLSKWERAISEHAFPTPWAVTENSRFSFPLSKHTGKFLLLLALRQTSSKQPFPSSMISPPLEQPTESTPPAATQVTGCSMGSWTITSQQSQWGALPRSEHHHHQAELCSNTGPHIPKWRIGGLAWFLPGFLPFCWEEPLPKSCSSVRLSRTKTPITHLPRGEQPCRQAPCLGHTHHLWQHLLSLNSSGTCPVSAVSSKHSPYSFSSCISSIFITQQTTQVPT